MRLTYARKACSPQFKLCKLPDNPMHITYYKTLKVCPGTGNLLNKVASFQNIN